MADSRVSMDRARELAARRAQLNSPAERIAFDNDPANGPFALRLVAALIDHRNPAKEQPPCPDTP